MAFTYLVGWSKEDKWYYGVRFAKGAKPEDLWSTYFTSSRHVKQLRKTLGEPDVIEVRKVFDSTEKARLWESKVLIRLNAVNDPRWLNKTDNTHKFYHEGPRGSFSDEHRQKLSEAKKGRKITAEHAERLHAGRKASKNSEEHKMALSRALKGRKFSDETRKKMAEAAHRRWHGDQHA